MRIVKVTSTANNTWVVSYNMWVCDEDHLDTCVFWVLPTKPTQRQIRRFKKRAAVYFRYGTRETQRRQREEWNRAYNRGAGLL